MGNVTTPIKGALAAYVAHFLVSTLGMADTDASYVADAAWLVLTAAIAYAAPATFANKTMSAAVAWVLARVLKVAPALVAVSIGGTLLVGCSAQQPGPSVPLTPEEVQAKAERRCEWAETLAASGKLAAVLALQDSNDDDVKIAVSVALAGVDGAVVSYCDAVRAGSGADAERAALAGLRAALDDLTARMLAVPPAVVVAG